MSEWKVMQLDRQPYEAACKGFNNARQAGLTTRLCMEAALVNYESRNPNKFEWLPIEQADKSREIVGGWDHPCDWQKACLYPSLIGWVDDLGVIYCPTHFFYPPQPPEIKA